MTDPVVAAAAECADAFWTKWSAIATASAAFVALFVAWIPVASAAASARAKDRMLKVAATSLLERARDTAASNSQAVQRMLETVPLDAIPPKAGRLKLSEADLLVSMLGEFDVLPAPAAFARVLAQLIAINSRVDALAAVPTERAMAGSVEEIATSLRGQLNEVVVDLDAMVHMLQQVISPSWWERFFPRP